MNLKQENARARTQLHALTEATENLTKYNIINHTTPPHKNMHTKNAYRVT